MCTTATRLSLPLPLSTSLSLSSLEHTHTHTHGDCFYRECLWFYCSQFTKIKAGNKCSEQHSRNTREKQTVYSPFLFMFLFCIHVHIFVLLKTIIYPKRHHLFAIFNATELLNSKKCFQKGTPAKHKLSIKKNREKRIMSKFKQIRRKTSQKRKALNTFNTEEVLLRVNSN